MFAWGPAAVWAAVLFLLSARSDLGAGGWLLDVPDEVQHFVAYGVLGALLAHGRFHGGRRLPHWALVALGAVYGVTDEVHQSFVPGRVPAAGDWLADALGVALGYTAAWLLASALLGERDTETKETTT